VFEGRAVKIEGNPAHPINGGGIGPKGQAGLQLLYHPDRIRGPLQRSGPRGSGRWTQITWDTAIGRLASELSALRGTGHPEGLVVIDGEPRGVVPRLWDRFLRAYGSPNHVTHASTSEGARALAMRWMQGSTELPAYDWQDTGYVLGFGVGLFDSWCQTIHMSRASGALRRGKPGQRAKFVHVASRFSVTAAKADEWIAIEPGTDGALALAIAHVLVRDGLYDRAFVGEHTFGFDDFRDKAGRSHRGFRTMVLSEYAPEKVSRITGVASETIVRIAHEPVVALGDGSRRKSGRSRCRGGGS
jgi:anaerobic selenocysteine-containing dehydrogenase